MRKKLAVILCIALIISLVPATAVFAAKKVKAKSVSVAPKSMTLAVGDIAQLNATKTPANATDKLTWTSSDKSVATVSSKGVVKGVSEGTATITVKTASKKTAKCTVTVKDFATKDELQQLSQNTYTKEEIDAMFAGNSGEEADETSLTCVNESYFPITKEYKRTIKGKEYPFSITVKSMSCKKYRIMDYVDGQFVPYRYDFTVEYSLSGYEEYRQAASSIEEFDWESPVLFYGLIGAQYTYDCHPEMNKQTMSFSVISSINHNEFYFDCVSLEI